MQEEEFGRDSRLSQAVPVARLGPSGFDPARVRPVCCITCNGHPDDIEDITEAADKEPRWCCPQCDAVWYEVPGSGLVRIVAVGHIWDERGCADDRL